ncbi:MAG: hypothetical protein ABJB03_11590 [Rhodoglobus sp.]
MTATTESDPESRALERAERKVTALFIGTSLVAAITIGSMMVGNWGGGVLEDHIEVLFWAGAILGGVGIALLGIGSLVTDHLRLLTGLTRVGLLLFLVAPVMCVTAVFVDYWI